MSPARVESPAAGRERISVLLVDDHALVRSGLRRTLEDGDDIVVVGETHDAESAVSAVIALSPTVVVMDYVLPRENGLVALQRIRQARPAAAVLMLSMRDDEALVRSCLEAGARGFLSKAAIDIDLQQAVRLVARGEQVTSWQPAAPARRAKRPGLERLTQREREVLTLLCRGHSARQVAGELGLSVFTVRTYRASILRALGFRRTMALVSYAVRRGLVDPS